MLSRSNLTRTAVAETGWNTTERYLHACRAARRLHTYTLVSEEYAALLVAPYRRTVIALPEDSKTRMEPLPEFLSRSRDTVYANTQ